MASVRSSHLFPTTTTLAIMTLMLLTTQSSARDTMYDGETLVGGQSLTAGNYNFIMQKDCNLVLYDSGKAVWNTRTQGKGNLCHVVLERTGELAIYNIGKKLWSNNSGGQTRTYLLILQRDRNVVIYGGGAATWATNTVA